MQESHKGQERITETDIIRYIRTGAFDRIPAGTERLHESPDITEAVEEQMVNRINRASFELIPAILQIFPEAEKYPAVAEAAAAQVIERLNRRSFTGIPQILQLFPDAERFPAVIEKAIEQIKDSQRRRSFKGIPPIVDLFSSESKMEILKAVGIDETQIEVYRENSERI
jgi:hypothetical protein